MTAQVESRADALRDALHEAEDAMHAAENAQAAIRAAMHVEDDDDEDGLLAGLQRLADELRIESVFAPRTPAEFLDRLEQLLVDVELEVAA